MIANSLASRLAHRSHREPALFARARHTAHAGRAHRAGGADALLFARRRAPPSRNCRLTPRACARCCRLSRRVSHGRVRFARSERRAVLRRGRQCRGSRHRAGCVCMQGADPIYFGLTGANAIDDRRTIPFFDPQREAVPRIRGHASHLRTGKSGSKTQVGADHVAADRSGQRRATRRAARPVNRCSRTEMGRLMDVTKLRAGFHRDPGRHRRAGDHSSRSADAERRCYAIDQFILRKGRAFIALDPASLSARKTAGLRSAFNPMATVRRRPQRWSRCCRAGVCR